MTTLWLMALLAGLFVWVRRDQRQYARFKQLDTTAERIACYRRWTIQSFVLLTGASLATLALLGRWDAAIGLPAEFHAAAALVQEPGTPRETSQDHVIGMAIGVSVGLVVVVALQLLRLRKAINPNIGDIEPLMARNAAEARAGLVLSLNAGFSEELFFRLALPLLIVQVTGSAPFALAASLLVFGLAHAYQGWKGILGTAFVGALLMLMYLKSGSLLRPMAAHALIDVIALIVHPAVGRWIAARQGRAATA